MKIKYFQGTDTLHIEFKTEGVVETKDLDTRPLLLRAGRSITPVPDVLIEP